MLILTFATILSACSQKGFETLENLEADKQPSDNLLQPDHPDNPTSQTAKSDFISGEVVTTKNGFVIKGSFGEISEKQTTSNGFQIEGAFYE